MMFNDYQTALGTQAVRAARDAWIAAVQARDLAAVVNLYDPAGGRLLGTLDTSETEDRDTPDRIRAYFRMFFEHDIVEPVFPPQVFEKDVQRLGPDHIAYHGYYSFRLTKADETRVIHAKFTFIYRRAAATSTNPPELLIVAHNSGITPVGMVELSR